MIVETEGILNSRPLTYNSSDVSDFSPITPNHFIRCGESAVYPPGRFDSDDMCSRKRWRQCQVLLDHVWKRWCKEYLPTLSARAKWRKESRNLCVGDVILVVDDYAPRGRWVLGRILETFSGSDGRVRSALIKTKEGTYHRPVCKLCILEES